MSYLVSLLTWFERDFHGKDGLENKSRGFAGVRDSPGLAKVARGLGTGDICGRIYFYLSSCCVEWDKHIAAGWGRILYTRY